MIRSTLFNVIFYLNSFLVAMMVWLISFTGSRNLMWVVLRYWGLSTLLFLFLILGARVEVRGREHLKKGVPQLIVSKHQSELDVIMLAALFWDISAVAMEELTKLPFFGRLLKTMDIVLIKVDSGPQGRTEQVIEGAKRIRAQERTMVIYPEGELMKLGAKERYRSGVGHMYGAMEVEAVPVAVSLGVIWPRREWRKNPGTVGAIEFMEPIPPGRPFEQFMAEVEDRIETRTMELIEEHAQGAALDDARDRYQRGANNERDLDAA